MGMLVIGSCTKSKLDSDCPVALRLKEEDFEENARLRVREHELAKWLCPAAEMYTGRRGKLDFSVHSLEHMAGAAIVVSAISLWHLYIPAPQAQQQATTQNNTQ